MSRQKKFKSKVFEGFNMDIGLDRDHQHQKVWSDKTQQTKHVQQMKQIDKIFQSIVKQRIFGTIISEKSRLSNQQYSILDKINKTVTCSFRTTKTSKIHQTTPISPAKKLSHYSIETPVHGLKSRRKQTLQPLNLTSYHTIDTTKKRSISLYDHSTILDGIKKFTSKQIYPYNQNSSGQRSPNISVNLNSAKFPSPDKFTVLFRSKTDIKSNIPQIKNLGNKKPNRKQSMFILKEMNLTDNDPFQQHFKKLSLTPTIFLYDIKLMKQTVIAKYKHLVNPRLLQYFFYFFGFPAIMTFRQYQKGIQRAFNCPISMIYFFTFRVLDESGNGSLTISDLFRFLQKYPETSYLQSQIFKIRKKINEVNQQLLNIEEQKKHVKANLEQILVINHKLKMDEVSQLLKQSVKQQINKGGQVKLTCYSQSILSLQHDVGVRLKHYELQNQKNESQAMNAMNIRNNSSNNVYGNNSNGNEGNNSNDNEMNNQQDGLRLSDFGQIFNGHRPRVFCMLVNILTSFNNEDYQ